METEKKRVVHEVLKSLCLDNGWSYGVFWKFNQRNSKLLTMEDAYYEGKMGDFIDDMLLQVHVLGNGIIGNAAFAKNNQWLFAENYRQDSIFLSFLTTQEAYQDDSEIYSQFSSGIETIAIVSVEPHGVVQFGSTRKVLETIQFVDQTKYLFQEIKKCDELTLPRSNISSFSNTEKDSLSNLIWPQTSYSLLENVDIINNGTSYDYTGTNCSTNDIQNIYPYTLDHGVINSSHIENEIKTATSESPYFQPDEFCIDFPFSFSSTPIQSSLTSTFNPENVVGNPIFDNLGVDFEFGDVDNIFADISTPVINGMEIDFTNKVPEFTVFTPRESLFSKLGIDQCLDRSNSECRSSVGIKRKIINCSDNQSCESSFFSQPKKSEDSIKPVKKRAKMGSRPKPKDRQQIQDRIAELRKLIPNGIKMSIDSLLAQTIKHMLFLENITKHAENLKKAEARKDNDYIGAWLFESWVQPMVDPVDVKDLSLPGQKQIKIICEEKGFFLEIVDIIQDLGLAILKGKMEVRENEIWACFIVEPEAKKYATKQDIYLSLHQILYQKGLSKMNFFDPLANDGVNEGSNLFDHDNQHICQLPINYSNGRL